MFLFVSYHMTLPSQCVNQSRNSADSPQQFPCKELFLERSKFEEVTICQLFALDYIALHKNGCQLHSAYPQQTE